ncbi:MAG: IS1634 family transposase, partial [Phycisphaerae bacterium]
IAQVLDEVIVPHGNRRGLSVGWLATAWLAYIISEADHRRNQVEPWAAERKQLLEALLGQQLRVKDFTDDRLGDLLRYLSDDTTWQGIETQLGERLIRVYNLQEAPVRLDSTSVAVYHNGQDAMLFQYGHSKDARPDLRQFKLMLASLDPLGLPLATLVVPGQRADDKLYLPTIRQARQVIGRGGKLYVGDGCMAGLQTRAILQDDGDYYLTALPLNGRVPQLLAHLLQPVFEGSKGLVQIRDQDGKPVAAAYEAVRTVTAQVGDKRIEWPERVLVVYSYALARRRRGALAKRLAKAEREILALTPQRGRGRRQWTELEPLQEKVAAILRRHRVEGLLAVSYELEVEQRQVRPYGSRPGRTVERRRYVTRVKCNTQAYAAARRRLGWRLLVTNAPAQRLSLEKAIGGYRAAYIIEGNFRVLKGKPLGIRPVYVKREDHAIGLTRLLTLAVRAIALLQYVVRRRLEQQGETIAGLYAGNPKRRTARPTTPLLLNAFKGITLTRVDLPGRETIYHITPLREVHERILQLAGLPPSIYEDLLVYAQAHPS